MNPNEIGIWAMSLGTIGISMALLVFVLSVFNDDIFVVNSSAYNITTKFLEGIYNIAKQVPNAGKIFGIGLIVFAFAGLGLGGYMLYNKARNY